MPHIGDTSKDQRLTLLREANPTMDLILRGLEKGQLLFDVGASVRCAFALALEEAALAGLAMDVECSTDRFMSPLMVALLNAEMKDSVSNTLRTSASHRGTELEVVKRADSHADVLNEDIQYLRFSMDEKLSTVTAKYKAMHVLDGIEIDYDGKKIGRQQGPLHICSCISIGYLNKHLDDYMIKNGTEEFKEARSSERYTNHALIGGHSGVRSWSLAPPHVDLDMLDSYNAIIPYSPNTKLFKLAAVFTKMGSRDTQWLHRLLNRLYRIAEGKAEEEKSGLAAFSRLINIDRTENLGLRLYFVSLESQYKFHTGSPHTFLTLYERGTTQQEHGIGWVTAITTAETRNGFGWNHMIHNAPVGGVGPQGNDLGEQNIHARFKWLNTSILGMTRFKHAFTKEHVLQVLAKRINAAKGRADSYCSTAYNKEEAKRKRLHRKAEKDAAESAKLEAKTAELALQAAQKAEKRAREQEERRKKNDVFQHPEPNSKRSRKATQFFADGSSTTGSSL